MNLLSTSGALAHKTVTDMAAAGVYVSCAAEVGSVLEEVQLPQLARVLDEQMLLDQLGVEHLMRLLKTFLQVRGSEQLPTRALTMVQLRRPAATSPCCLAMFLSGAQRPFRTMRPSNM